MKNYTYTMFIELLCCLIVVLILKSINIPVTAQNSVVTKKISIASNGMPGNKNTYSPSVSDDGRYIAFISAATNLVPDDTNNALDIFIHDQQTGETIRASVASNGTQANESSFGYYATALSADGRFVAFASTASNLVDDDTNQVNDIFVHDRQERKTTRVSVASDGSQGNANSYEPSISADGRVVAFVSSSTNLVINDTNNSTFAA